MKVNSFFIIALLISFLGCSSQVIYQRTGKIQISEGDLEKHDHKVSKEIELEYYIFGTYPHEKYQIDLDNEFLDFGLLSVANLKTKEFKTTWQHFVSIISFGLYTPKTIQISGRGQKPLR